MSEISHKPVQSSLLVFALSVDNLFLKEMASEDKTSTVASANLHMDACTPGLMSSSRVEVDVFWICKTFASPLQVHNHDEDVVGGAGPRLDLRFLLPSALCGVLIGKSGSTIRQFGQARLPPREAPLHFPDPPAYITFPAWAQ